MAGRHKKCGASIPTTRTSKGIMMLLCDYSNNYYYVNLILFSAIDFVISLILMIFQIHDAKLRCKYYISVTKWKQYTCILLKIGVYVLKISNFCRGGNVTLVQAEFEYKATVGGIGYRNVASMACHSVVDDGQSQSCSA